MKKDESYLVIMRSLQGNFDRKTTEMALIKRGYERYGTGYYFLRIPNDANFNKKKDEEFEWLQSFGLVGDVVKSKKGFRTKYDPYNQGW
jgi:hypothetical protein